MFKQDMQAKSLHKERENIRNPPITGLDLADAQHAACECRNLHDIDECCERELVPAHLCCDPMLVKCEWSKLRQGKSSNQKWHYVISDGRIAPKRRRLQQHHVVNQVA